MFTSEVMSLIQPVDPTVLGEGDLVRSTRGGALFNAHSYPTKINAEAVLQCVLRYSRPGDLLFDGFAGSGATGLATVLARDASVGSAERDAILYDISALATFVTTTLLNPPNPAEFRHAAAELLDDVRCQLAWMYVADSPGGSPGEIRYTVWSEVVECPQCGKPGKFWDLAVRLEPAHINELLACDGCGSTFRASGAVRTVTETYDDLLSERRTHRLTLPAQVYGRAGSKMWRRGPVQSDIDTIERVALVKLPDTVPVRRMMDREGAAWGEMYRAGYHTGMSHVHHFYSRRNLLALGTLLQHVDAAPPALRDALRFWISSYNASHSTLMTRVVAKAGVRDLVVTSAQPGALYVSGLPVEKNVFQGMARKIDTIARAFEITAARRNKITITRASSLTTNLPSDSVDYVFTDPPFGSNIQYSEVNFISEAWLRLVTDSAEEVIVSKHQGKSLADYEAMLTTAFGELWRVLKPGKLMTVAFHSSTAAVWNALHRAWIAAGFELFETLTLDKTQASFKQTTTSGAVWKDALLTLRKVASAQESRTVDHTVEPMSVVRAHLARLPSESALRSKQHLYNHLVRQRLRSRAQVDIDAMDFFTQLEREFTRLGDSYYSAESEV